MTAQITKNALDLGIVARDPQACLAFYRDVIGLTDLGEMPMPGGTMHRLGCGDSQVKIVALRTPPETAAPPGGLRGGTGYRYFTITVGNLAEVVQECEQAGHPVVVPPTELAPGLTIAMVEDPDGNWLELLSTA